MNGSEILILAFAAVAAVIMIAAVIVAVGRLF